MKTTEYPYYTTALAVNRRFPTYQLHAETINQSLPPLTILGICVLETMAWLRSRMKHTDTLPKEVCLPDPADYESFDVRELKSFQLNLGFSIDVVYSEKIGLWTFCITENDMGTNLGTPHERRPVVGRRFETHIAFRTADGGVEVGVQTICSEPSDTTEDCEVFRPALIKNLYRNKNVGLRHILDITESPFEITASKELQRIKSAVADPLRDLPIVIITTPAAVDDKPEIPNLDFSFSAAEAVKHMSIISQEHHAAFEIDYEKFGIKAPMNHKKKPGLETAVAEAEKKFSEAAFAAAEKNHEIIVPKTVDAGEIARRKASFGFVCTVADDMFEKVRAAFCEDLSKGDIIIIGKDKSPEIMRFAEFSGNIPKAQEAIRNTLTLYPMRRSLNFGNIIFVPDARIQEYRNRRSEKMTADEENTILEKENQQLRQKLKNYEEQVRDANSEEEKIRELEKKNSALKSEIGRANADNKKLSDEITALRKKMQTQSPTLDFYRKKIHAAASFPRSQDAAEVKNWAQKEFSDTVIIHKNALASLKKKRPNTVDMAMLCDGIYYLHGYALYRQGKITADTLDLYAEENNWEACGCGDAALKMFRDDYTIQMPNGDKELSLHIKHGISMKHLVRIYFYYDEQSEHVVIGSMPDHLPTLADKT